MAIESSQGRLQDRRPVSVIDIGSNSIRLVIYEGIARSPSVLFNEKMLAGLGKGIVTTGELDPNGVKRSLEEFRRFRALSEQAGAESLHVIATAAAREARNGPEFIAQVEKILGTKIRVLSGREEARLSALGVTSSFYKPDGIVGDLGGGSLELIEVRGEEIGDGFTLPLGGLRLQDMAGESLEEATKIVRKQLERADWLLSEGEGRAFYCVGGTWRNLAKLHMLSVNYPLQVMHSYKLDPKKHIKFLEKVARGDVKEIKGSGRISKSRRNLLPYGAIVLLEIIRAAGPSELVISANGVREGYLQTLLQEPERSADPLLSAAEELAILRSRSVAHARELVEWSDHSFQALGISETEEEARYRRAACLLADIGWRAHPDYRGLQSLNLISHGAFVGIDHPGRAYIALANLFRHEGLYEDILSDEMRELATPRYVELAQLVGGLLRVVYLLTASMPGIIPRLRWERRDENSLVLVVPRELDALIGERPQGRMEQLAKVTGLKLDFELA